MTEENPAKWFLDQLANELAFDLQSNNGIRNFTTNSELIGAYAEASVRKLVERVVFPLRVCRGAVIDEKLCQDEKHGVRDVPQIDTIIWSPSPAPAIFCVSDFGLVPRSSAFGVLEIKRSAYTDAAKHMADGWVLNNIQELVADVKAEIKPQISPGLGVIVLKQKNQPDPGRKADEWIKSGRIVVLLEETCDSNLKVNHKAVHTFVNFLIRVRLRADIMNGRDGVNLNVYDTRATK